MTSRKLGEGDAPARGARSTRRGFLRGQISDPRAHRPPVDHIASLVVYVHPEAMDRLCDFLESRANVEIHARHQAGKLVVVIDTDSEAALSSFTTDLQGFPGTLTVNLVCHHAEERSALAEPVHTGTESRSDPPRDIWAPS